MRKRPRKWALALLVLGSGLAVSSCAKKKTETSAGPSDAPSAQDFLARNAKMPGVITLPSGLEYKILTPGTGRSPTQNDYAVVNYTGRHVDGREFDDSYKLGEPVTVPVAGVIPGWAEALEHMKEGAKWEIYIPPKLAYGGKGMDDIIKPDETLIFDVELIKVMTPAEMAAIRLAKFKKEEAYKRKNEEFLAENKIKPGVITTASGLEYKVLRPGSGPHPTLESSVVVNYRGTLIDGTEFDSSYARGTPATFPVNDVIRGWTEALLKMRKGAKWMLYVPADLAYGASGAGKVIQPYSTLIFEVELLDIK